MSKPNDARKGFIGEVAAKNDDANNHKITPQFIQDLKNGSAEAFNRLVTSHSGHLKKHLALWLDNDEDIKEACQDALLYLWEKREALTADSFPRFYRYLYYAGKYQAFRILKNRQNHRKYCHQRLHEPLDYADAPDEVIEADQSEQIVRETVDRMPPVRHSVYQMKQEQGLSYAEIALRLNITQSTVRDHFQLAVRDIKEALAER